MAITGTKISQMAELSEVTGNEYIPVVDSTGNKKVLTSKFAKKEDIPNVSSFITTTTADSKYQPKGNYLTSIPSEYVTTTDLGNYVTTSTANSTFATKEELGNIDAILDNINGEVIQ